MNFNHLLPKNEVLTKCSGSKTHSFMPTSHVEATFNHVAVRFRCKKCGKLATAFLEQEQYKINENIITKFGELR